MDVIRQGYVIRQGLIHPEMDGIRQGLIHPEMDEIRQQPQSRSSSGQQQ